MHLQNFKLSKSRKVSQVGSVGNEVAVQGEKINKWSFLELLKIITGKSE